MDLAPKKHTWRLTIECRAFSRCGVQGVRRFPVPEPYLLVSQLRCEGDCRPLCGACNQEFSPRNPAS